MGKASLCCVLGYRTENAESLASIQTKSGGSSSCLLRTRLGWGCSPSFPASTSSLVSFTSSVQFSSVPQLCPTVCNPMNCSTPGLPVHHQLPESTQTHVYGVGDAIQPSHHLCPFLLLPSIFPSIRVFPNSQLFASGGQSVGVSALASVLAMNTQD